MQNYKIYLDKLVLAGLPRQTKTSKPLFSATAISMMWKYELRAYSRSGGKVAVFCYGEEYSDRKWPISLGLVKRKDMFRGLCALLSESPEVQIIGGGIFPKIHQKSLATPLTNELLKACWETDEAGECLGRYFLSLDDTTLNSIIDIAESLSHPEVLKMAKEILSVGFDYEDIFELNEEITKVFGSPESMPLNLRDQM